MGAVPDDRLTVGPVTLCIADEGQGFDAGAKAQRFQAPQKGGSTVQALAPLRYSANQAAFSEQNLCGARRSMVG